MKRIIFVISCWLLVPGSFAQTVNQRLQKAFQQFETDPQLKHAISSLYVINANTGKVVFDKNSQIGLAPASTQKIITATTAFELLGKDYRYKTELGYDGIINNMVLNGNLYFIGSGDPTLGSSRWLSTKDSILMFQWWQNVQNGGIKRINGSVWFAKRDFSARSIPDGWIWQDIGNYYGAGNFVLNWKENQYDVVLSSDSEIGQKVKILSPQKDYVNELKSASKGSGDNAYVYYDNVISGTIPIGEPYFKVSAAETDPINQLCTGFSWYLNSKNIYTEAREKFDSHTVSSGIEIDSSIKLLGVHYSPTLDSIVYCFLQKSINLYGEALIKTLAYEKNGFGSTDGGVKIVKDFWKQKGLDENELNIGDGSGLSPENRITTHAQVEILNYAKKQAWFPYFFDALPEYNNMKMKSGTIKAVKGFCGYHKARNGQEYIFSFLVNNYNGSTSELVGKMYRVLNELK
jgi:serine-type D-Ala-D-Ala carboxypeptidase/endopeptidase (penicillin-binding protein 4)